MPSGAPSAVASLTEPSPVVQATFLFTDIEGSTRLARRLGQARWMETISDHHRIVGGAIAAHGGRVDHTEGDAFIAVFLEPAAAVRAAVEAQRGLAGHGWPESVGMVRVRMGLHTGRVLAHTTGYLGLDAHLAARVASAANGGQILITAATLREAGGGLAVRDLGPHRLKDFPQPERLYHVMVDTVEEAAVPAPRTASVRPTNLPPQTRSLVGRERELLELSELLRSDAEHIVTVTGVGGSGKTRLAVAVGTDLLDEFPGGVFLVRLAGIQDEGSIVPMIAEVLGITGQAEGSLLEVLETRLNDQPVLLILDNFEHLLAGAPVLSLLTGRASELRVLVTSQVPLRIGAERLFPLGPLAAPDAARLFVERARRSVHEVVPEEGDRLAIERICTRLEFMPLGIELAAARVGLFGIRDLERRLERPLSVLTRGERDAPERHRSLRATIEWTHALLGSGPRLVFARLSACAGAISLEAVAAIAGGEGSEVLDDLEQLLEFSFVRRQEDRRLGIRFLVPQALRDYALERLTEAGEEDQVSRMHAEYVARVAYGARLWKWGATPEQRTALLAVADEIRPAVAWARGHDPELHVHICAALCSYWAYRGVLSEVTEELEWAWEGGAGIAADRAWVLTLLAKYAQLEADAGTSGQLADRLVAQWDTVDDKLERALGLVQVSWVFAWEDRLDEGIDIAREALAILRETGDQRLILRGLVRLAQALADADDAAGAEAVLAEADDLAGDDPTWELTPIHADCALIRGNNAAATRLYADSLAWSSASGEFHQVLMDMSCLSVSLARLGEATAALELHELWRLEGQRTGRVGDYGFLWGHEARPMARLAVDAAAAERAAARARAVPVIRRADHAIEIAREVVARAPKHSIQK
jgi:predicted ATPase/class 3 adenylate cyclase